MSDGPLPYPNTLKDATEYCCRADVAPGCGGVTFATNTNWSFGRYEARASGQLNPLPDSTIRSWLKRPGSVGGTPFFNTTLNLIFNPALEHSRDYRCAYSAQSYIHAATEQYCFYDVCFTVCSFAQTGRTMI
jgi:hypothetical protein